MKIAVSTLTGVKFNMIATTIIPASLNISKAGDVSTVSAAAKQEAREAVLIAAENPSIPDEMMLAAPVIVGERWEDDLNTELMAAGNYVLVTFTVGAMRNATATAAAMLMVDATNTATKAVDFYKSIQTSVKATPTIVGEPGDIYWQIGSQDPTGMAVLPGTQRIIPYFKLQKWEQIRATWASTKWEWDSSYAKGMHKKEIPIHDSDPSTLPCLLAYGVLEKRDLELVGIDTVPLMRRAPINCDGTIPQQGDNKPKRRFAVADPSIKPTPSAYHKKGHHKHALMEDVKK